MSYLRLNSAYIFILPWTWVKGENFFFGISFPVNKTYKHLMIKGEKNVSSTRNSIIEKIMQRMNDDFDFGI